MASVQEPGVQMDSSTEATLLDDNAIVISGMSGVLPGCHNIMEFAEKLYNKENMVMNGNVRWKSTYPEIPKYHGIIPDLDRFDPQFFMVYHMLSNNMDPMSRKLLEHSYQAIFDAGVCASQLSGKRVAVYMTAGLSEWDKRITYSTARQGILGSNRTMYANRISYYLNLKGPSLFIEADTCGFMVAMEQACQAIMNGQCEAALVGSAKVLLDPQSSIHYHRLVPACRDGKMKSYDMKADGQSLSEGVNVLFLQKRKDALRIYASVSHIKTMISASNEERSINQLEPYHEPVALNKLLRTFYDEANISPSLVEYVEGFGAALPKVDKSELQVLEEIFCKDRTNPLLVGSVTSNVGFTDAASGGTGIIKVLLAYQKGELAGNINCENPRQDVLALRDGRMRILTDHHAFRRSYAAVNNFSLTGLNGHLLLQGHYKAKDLTRYKTDLPYLVTVSGRQESCVQKILDDVKERSLDPEVIALLHNIHKQRIKKHLARGFSIYATKDDKTVMLREKVDYHDEAQRPLWFVYSGMGSQWPGMGNQLMKLPIFADAIKRCHQVLEPKGIDLINVITSTDKNIFDNILNTFVGIAAIQIGLTDILKAMGLVPDNIIGHSVGEIGCAYCDGCCTAEEMILMAYYRGLVSIQTPFIRGSMAAVAMGYKQISKITPPEIEVACHNGPNSSTISGPIELVQEFVAKLTAQGIFVKEVQCSNIAYHSRYIAEAGPQLLKYFKEVVDKKILRSERWISTSYQQEDWHTSAAKYSSPEYHTHNLLSPVLFEESLKLVPTNAVLVEIAPHGLLQAILKRSLSASNQCIPLTMRGHEDNALFLLEAIGKLYMDGYNMDISVLYPKIDFPVSTKTQSLSHLVEWYYSDKLNICEYLPVIRQTDAVFKPIISIYDDEYQYLKGNIIEGTRVFPFAGALVAVWDALLMTFGQPKKQVSVKFSDVTFHVQPPLYDHCLLNLTVTVQRGSGRFEVTYEHGIVAEGYVETEKSSLNKTCPISAENNSILLTQDDIYKMFNEKGCQYSGEFCSIYNANLSLDQARLIWKNNWVTFLDGALQLNALRCSDKEIYQLLNIKSLQIDVEDHPLNSNAEGNLIDARFSELHNTLKCGGISIKHANYSKRPSFVREFADLKELAFVPFFQEENVDIFATFYVFLQIIAENLNTNYLKILYVSEPSKICLLDSIKHLLNSPPKLNINVVRINMEEIQASNKELRKLDILFVDNLLSDEKVFESLYHALPTDTFIVSLGVETENKYPTSLYRQVCAVGKGRARIELARFRPSDLSPTTASVTVKISSDLEFLHTTRKNLPKQHRLLILTSYPAPFDLKNLVKQWRSEPDRNQINVLMMNKYLQDDDVQNLPYIDLAFNVIDHGTWGGEYYVPIRDTADTSNNNTLGRVVSLRGQPGDLNSLHWAETPEVTGHGINVTVHYAGLSFYDAKKATAAISVKNASDDGFGMDFSGVTQGGDRVMGIVRKGAVSRRVVAKPNMLWPVPKYWTLEDAATVPLPYVLAFYCLTVKATLLRGMTVLVHGGAGSLGQAVISIALANGCQVFTTVSDVHKKAFLRKMFPNLPASHIGNSRDITFRDMIINVTNGKRCDIIISSVEGGLKNYTQTCGACLAITLDVVQIDSQENYNLGMSILTEERNYSLVDFASIFKEQNQEEIKVLQLLVSEGIARGYVRPLSRVTYTPCEVPRAFRLLAASRHRGRVLIGLNYALPVVQSRRIICLPDHCQLFICDGKGFGLQLADRFVSNGARILHIHYPQHTGYLEYKVQSWKKLRVQVHTSYGDLSTMESVLDLLKDTRRIASIEGIYIFTTGLSDESKARALETVANLDSASRKLCPSLRYFVVLNGDHAIGNEISLNRVRSGFPSLSIQLYDLEKYEVSEQANDDLVNNTALKRSIALDAIERAIHKKKPVAVAYAKSLPRYSVLEEVAAIPGVTISSTTVDRTTLEQVGVDHGRAQELSNILKEKFNITLPKESIPDMTIAQLKQIQEYTEVKEELTGLSGYFNCFEYDELLANTNMISMPTLIQTSHMRSDEFDGDLTYLCIVPGMEGNHERFHILCQRLKIPAVVLQPGVDLTDETIEDLAHRLIDVMMVKIKSLKHFYLLGYEFGVFVVLQMAAILERRGLTGTVYCLGGTPEEIRTTIQLQLGNLGPTLQDNLIRHMYTMMTNCHSDQLQIKERQNWEEKVTSCLEAMRGSTQCTKQYAQDIINVAYTRIKLIHKYILKPQQLRAKIIILRAKLPTTAVDSFNSYPQLLVHELNSTLANAPKDLKCPAIINKYLEPEILTDYSERNHNETSLVNQGNMFK